MSIDLRIDARIGLSRQPCQVHSQWLGANDYRRQGVTSLVRNSPSVSVTKSSHTRVRGLIDYGVYGARVSRTVAESPSRSYLSPGLAALPASGENISRGRGDRGTTGATNDRRIASIPSCICHSKWSKSRRDFRPLEALSIF